jgi:hypothetical protein
VALLGPLLMLLAATACKHSATTPTALEQPVGGTMAPDSAPLAGTAAATPTTLVDVGSFCTAVRHTFISNLSKPGATWRSLMAAGRREVVTAPRYLKSDIATQLEAMNKIHTLRGEALTRYMAQNSRNTANYARMYEQTTEINQYLLRICGIRQPTLLPPQH